MHSECGQRDARLSRRDPLPSGPGETRAASLREDSRTQHQGWGCCGTSPLSRLFTSLKAKCHRSSEVFSSYALLMPMGGMPYHVQGGTNCKLSLCIDLLRMLKGSFHSPISMTLSGTLGSISMFKHTSNHNPCDPTIAFYFLSCTPPNWYCSKFVAWQICMVCLLAVAVSVIEV